jgi:hypothetical protein
MTDGVPKLRGRNLGGDKRLPLWHVYRWDTKTQRATVLGTCRAKGQPHALGSAFKVWGATPDIHVRLDRLPYDMLETSAPSTPRERER